MADVNKEIGVRIDVITEDVDAANKRIAALDEHIKKLQADIETMRKRGKKSGDEMAAGFKAAQAQAQALPGPIGRVADALSNISNGAGAFSKSLGSLRGAIASTGILALAVALGSLYAYFTESEKGARQFRVALGYLNGITETFMNVLEKMGETLINAFRNPLQGIKDLGNALVNFLSNPTKVIGDVGRELSEVSKAAKENAKAFAELARAQNELKRTERELTVARAESNKTIAEARLIADDTNKSIDERIKAVRLAGKIESEVAAEEQKIAQQRLAAIQQQIKLDGDKEDLLDQEAAAKARIIELERENIMRRKRLQSEELGLLREAEAEKKALADAEAARLKEAEAEKKKLADAELARMKELADERQRLFEQEQALLKSNLAALTDARIEAMEDGWQKELAATTLEFERKIAQIQGNGQIEAELRAQLADNMNDKLAAINKKWLDQNLAQTRANNDKILADEERLRAARLNMAQATGGGLIAIGKVVSAAMADNAEVAKGIATAEVWINAATATASAISKAVQSSATPYDMIANIAVAVATVAGAIASTISILDKAQIPGGAGGSVGAMPSFTSSAPTAAPVSTNVTQLGNTQQAELQTIQAYVVETQITGTQSNIGQIYEQATFGLGG